MPEPTQASALSVFDAGLARLAGIGRALLASEAVYEPTGHLAQSARDLRFALEAMSLLPSTPDALAVQSYAQETYGLFEVALDPLLSPLLPVIPAQGAKIRPLVLVVNGKALEVNDQLVFMGYRLVPVTAPTYNTSLLPTETAGPVTYNGLPGTQLAFDAPVPTGGAMFLQLFVGGVQVGRVDFPASAVGQGFSLLYQGTLCYGTFQATSDNTLTLA